jgi:hypothetical protein
MPFDFMARSAAAAGVQPAPKCRHERADFAQAVALHHEQQIVTARQQITTLDFRKPVDALGDRIEAQSVLRRYTYFDQRAHNAGVFRDLLVVENRTVANDDARLFITCNRRRNLRLRTARHHCDLRRRLAPILNQNFENLIHTSTWVVFS